ncbi:MAG: hypothetical protein ABIK99_02585 [candidate division WOR-3 bacterium]
MIKKLILSTAFLVSIHIVPLPIKANQIWIEIGNGTGVEYWPFCRYFNYSIWEGIYLQSEIDRAGDIIGMGFHTWATFGLTIESVKIYMRETTATTLSDGLIPNSPPEPWVLVWNGEWPNLDTGWNYIFFPTPFYYSNEGNLLILIIKGFQVGTHGNSPMWYYTSTSPNFRVRRNVSDARIPGSGYASYNRPNIRLGFSETGIKEGKEIRKQLLLGREKNFEKIFNFSARNAKFRIYDAFGKMILEDCLLVKRLPKGIYFLLPATDGYRKNKKLIVY